MPHSKKPGKDAMKQSVLTPKEKKAAKQEKKHAGDAVSIVEKSSPSRT